MRATRLLQFFVASFLALVLGVAAEDELECAMSKYYASQYTCFYGQYLCPILEGIEYLRCTEDCYDPTAYSCDDGVLVQFDNVVLNDCGAAKFNPDYYVCVDPSNGLLCPHFNDGATLRCGDDCYSPTNYKCKDGLLSPISEPSCAQEYELVSGGDSCCPGLVADKDGICQAQPNSGGD